MEEAGLPGYESSAWFGLVSPAAVPRYIVSKLNAEVVRIVELADVKRNLASQGAAPLVMTPDEFDAFMKAETAKWAKIVKASATRAD
jgi:tripartite-type tricarboxylate transporter receptor subunit TctC